jgi:hypothetical protein
LKPIKFEQLDLEAAGPDPVLNPALTPTKKLSVWVELSGKFPIKIPLVANV